VEEHFPVPASRVQHSPWKTVGVVIASLGTPAAAEVLHPLLGEIITSAEAVVVLVVILMAVFGNQDQRERAFRLLRWLRDRPEPPSQDHPAGDPAVTARSCLPKGGRGDGPGARR